MNFAQLTECDLRMGAQVRKIVQVVLLALDVHRDGVFEGETRVPGLLPVHGLKHKEA